MATYQDQIIDIYTKLADPNWTPANDVCPEDLVAACYALHAARGEEFEGDYYEAIDIASHLTAEKARYEDTDWMITTLEHRLDRSRACTREVG